MTPSDRADSGWTEHLSTKGRELDIEIECCEACQRIGLCGQHQRDMDAFCDLAEAYEMQDEY